MIVTAAVPPNAHKLFEKESHSTRGGFQMTPLLLLHALPQELQLDRAAYEIIPVDRQHATISTRVPKHMIYYFKKTTKLYILFKNKNARQNSTN